MEEELVEVRAKVVDFYFDAPACGKPTQRTHFVFTVIPRFLANPGFGFADSLLVPCHDLSEEFRVHEKQVVISGYRLNCSGKLDLPCARLSRDFSNKFEITRIQSYN